MRTIDVALSAVLNDRGLTNNSWLTNNYNTRIAQYLTK